MAYYPWIGSQAYQQSRGSPSDDDGSAVTIGHSSQLFMSGNQQQLIVGAGGGNGIWVDEELTKGKSERCDTFRNKPLCSTGDFTCAVVEVVAFV